MRRLPVALLATALLACSGGSKKSSPPAYAGCDLGDGSCIRGPGLTEAICTADWAGTFIAAGCPTADQIGMCLAIPDLIVMGAYGEIVFYTPGYDAAAAVNACWFEGGEYHVACPSDGGASMSVSCTWTGDMCDQINGLMNSCQLDHLSFSCTDGGGSYSATACSTTGAVSGHCRYTDVEYFTGVPVPGGTMDEYYYTAIGWTVPAAQAYCGSPPAGTWIY